MTVHANNERAGITQADRNEYRRLTGLLADHYARRIRARGILEEDEFALWANRHAYPRREVFGRHVAELAARRGAARAGVRSRSAAASGAG